jgi:muramoyltetrapeptide carboxypeptidase
MFGAALALAGCASLPTASRAAVLKPPRLRVGDTVGLIAPSGALSQEQLASRIRNMESLGLRPKLGKHVLGRWGSYGGTIEQRVEDLHAMFADESVRAIWAARGGSGGAGLLPHIDYRLIARNPKVLIGYSDLTALLLAIHAKTGLITFHGPTAGSRFTDYNVAHLKALLFEAKGPYTMRHASENLAPPSPASAAAAPASACPVCPSPPPDLLNEVRTYQHGVARGPLLGGNLSVLSALIGTPYMPALPGSLMFLEEVGEEPYRVDRMLHQLQQANPQGVRGLAQCAGVMVGVFTRYMPKPTDTQLSLGDVFKHHLSGLGVPAVSGYSFGHIAHQMLLPIGLPAELNTREGSLTLLEPAVA